MGGLRQVPRSPPLKHTTGYEKRVEQQKGRPNVKVCLQKKIWKSIIKSVFDYRFKSNKHTHMFLFVTQAFWVFIVRILFFLVCNLCLFEITEWEPVKRDAVCFNSFK